MTESKKQATEKREERGTHAHALRPLGRAQGAVVGGENKVRGVLMD